MKPKWPKRQSVSNYIAANYADGDRSRDAVINDIKAGRLPGVKFGRKWYIYVLPDGEPAYGYSEGIEAGQPATEEAVDLTGNAIADSILARLAANNGMRVSKAS
jgi:hypothetical protein